MTYRDGIEELQAQIDALRRQLEERDATILLRDARIGRLERMLAEASASKRELVAGLSADERADLEEIRSALRARVARHRSRHAEFDEASPESCPLCVLQKLDDADRER